MLTGELSSADRGSGGRTPQPAPQQLGADASALYADLRASPFLRQLLTRSSGLMGTRAGSISLVDGQAERYHKVAERGALCQLGRSFPLDEGVTGQVVAQRRPVVLGHYGDVHSGHVAASHPAYDGSVAAVPIWWRGDVIGVNVAFAGTARRFTAGEVDDLELLTQLAAAGIVASSASDPTVARLVRRARRQTDPHAATTPGAQADDSRPPKGESNPAPFTEREREVLTLLARGASDRAVAEALVISHRTVEKHVGALLRKTGTSSRTAAVMRCVTEGWLPR